MMLKLPLIACTHPEPLLSEYPGTLLIWCRQCGAIREHDEWLLPLRSPDWETRAMGDDWTADLEAILAATKAMWETTGRAMSEGVPAWEDLSDWQRDRLVGVAYQTTKTLREVVAESVSGSAGKRRP
jgi:hypothetical protein